MSMQSLKKCLQLFQLELISIGNVRKFFVCQLDLPAIPSVKKNFKFHNNCFAIHLGLFSSFVYVFYFYMSEFIQEIILLRN